MTGAGGPPSPDSAKQAQPSVLRPPNCEARPNLSATRARERERARVRGSAREKVREQACVKEREG